MKTVFHITKVLVFVAGLLGSHALLAHNTLKVTVPADAAALSTMPEFIELTFSDETYLESFELFSADGKPVALEFTPSTTLSSHFSISVPELEAGKYTAKWTVEGSDTHRISGEFSFGLKSNE
jgi:hypothetical protein